jgi:hypothetical protein
MTVPKHLQAAWKAVGGLSTPSKMPCFSYSLPAKDCITGSKLRKVENSVCSTCYAMKGMYSWPNVKNALELRLKLIDSPEWVENMVTLISNLESSGYFRWFDSGDLHSTEQLDKICEIAKRLPKYKFWLPTKEYKIVSAYLKKHKCPVNLNIRLSGYMIDGPAPVELAKKLGVTTSTVTRSEKFNCPSSKQGNMCLLCRKCWDKKVQNVSYHWH